jgi:hypothetical protein
MVFKLIIDIFSRFLKLNPKILYIKKNICIVIAGTKLFMSKNMKNYGILIVFNNFPAFLKTIKLRWIEMRRISISCLKPGMKLGSPIYNSRSDELLVPGVTLTDTYICRLRDLGLSYVWIEDEVFTGLEVNEVVSLKTRIATIRKIRDITMNTKVTGKLLVNPEELYDTVNSFISEIFQNKDAIFYLSHLYSYDDYIFSHSVNVCIMALMTGITLGYRGTKLTDLGVGALLHDLGKIKIPENIINKPGKLTKEDIDKVRHIEGFPIGKDEDIIALSNPPYYTACPNPFIEDFIKEHGKPYDEATDDYHREPFAADVSEGKNDPIYNAHSYHTKVPYKAIMRYILHYTEPGDIVFDGFCGTGMTGVAAQMCENPDPDFKYQLEKEMPGIKWGARKAILNDLSPAATFIAYNYNTPVDVAEFQREATRILEECEKECGWMYETRHVINGKLQTGIDGEPVSGRINYTVWSDVFICPTCSNEIVFWDAAVDKKNGKVNDTFFCPHCRSELTKRNCVRAQETHFDTRLNKFVTMIKQVPVLINYSVGKKRYEKTPDEYDLTLMISRLSIGFKLLSITCK